MLSLEEVRPGVELAGCYHYRREESFDYRMPVHHLMLVLHGEVAVRTLEKAFTARAGDLVCIRPAEENHYTVSADTFFFQATVEFAPPPLHRLTPFLPGYGLLPLRQPLGANLHEARKCFEKLCLEITHAGSAPRLRQQAAICDLLAIVAMAAGADESSVEQQPDPWLRARQRIEAALTKPFCMPELTAELGVSTTYFIREFRRRFDITPKACHTQARLREAVRRLRDGEESIKAVALSLGFSDPKSFTRRFQHHYGFNPSALAQGQAPSGADKTLKANRGLFPMNEHLVPPGGSAGTSTYLPTNLDNLPDCERSAILDKFENPANWV